MQEYHKDLHEVFEYFNEPIICTAEDKIMSYFLYKFTNTRKALSKNLLNATLYQAFPFFRFVSLRGELFILIPLWCVLF